MSDARPAGPDFAELVRRACALAGDPTPAADRSGATGTPAGPAGATGTPAVLTGAAVLGVAGPPGAGKTTLAAAVTAAVVDRLGEGAARAVPMDGFHLADVELDRLGRRDRKGAPDTFDAAGYAALLVRIRAGGPDTVYAPAFERDLEQPVAGAVPVPPGTRLVVTEGLYLLGDGPWARVRPLLDEVWWVDQPDADRTDRLVARHERFGKAPAAARAWVARVDGANARTVGPGRDRADLVVAGDLRLPGPAT